MMEQLALNNIKDLLNSSNIDDVVLGIIIGMQQEVLLNMFEEAPGHWQDMYSIRYRIESEFPFCWMIVNKTILSLGAGYYFIAIVKQEEIHNFPSMSLAFRIIYNDGSIPEITEGI